VEAMLFPGWFVKTEYRFADYGSKTIPIPVATFPFGQNIHPFVQTVRTELTYRFNSQNPTPVVARY
jgi:outer membrane immunogenic protein